MTPKILYKIGTSYFLPDRLLGVGKVIVLTKNFTICFGKKSQHSKYNKMPNFLNDH
jgi:hypothetical protein